MIKLADYLIPDSATDQQIVEALRCPVTRLCNLYRIKDKLGFDVPFRPLQAQLAVIEAIYLLGWRRLLIPKSRQLMISSITEMIFFDMALFTPDVDTRTNEPAALDCPEDYRLQRAVKAAIIERSREEAEKRMEKVGYAWERLPRELKDGTGLGKTWTRSHKTWAHGAEIQAGMRARGDTLQALHVSEWGHIAYYDPQRSKEIITGAFPSVGPDGVIVGESTHVGGKHGDWYDAVTEALETPEEDKTSADFRVLFFPWYMEPAYTLDGRLTQLDQKTHRYLTDMEKRLGIEFTPGQKLWYFKTARQQRRHMFSEYPTVIEECWMAPTPGLIFAEDIDRARSEGRISSDVLHMEGLPVYTSWDLGAPTNTVCWIWQLVGHWVNLLECLFGGDDCKTAMDWADRLRREHRNRFRYGSHFLPHDGGTHWKHEFDVAGLENVVVLDRPLTVWQNINRMYPNMSRCRFNAEACRQGIHGLEAYHSKEEPDGSGVKDVPVHDAYSHPSTAFTYIGQAIEDGRVADRSAIPTKGVARTTVKVSKGGHERISRGAINVTVSRNR